MMNKYHKKFLESASAECLINLFARYRGGAKEITESMAMLEAAKHHVDDLNSCVVAVVGDGCSPRTASLFAYFTKAQTVSIDPNMNLDHWEEHVKKWKKMGFPPERIHVWKMLIEDCHIDCEGKRLVVVWPHSHAPMLGKSFHNYSERTDIALPCCVQIPRKLMEIPHISYDDYGIESPKRTIHIWKNVSL